MGCIRCNFAIPPFSPVHGKPPTHKSLVMLRNYYSRWIFDRKQLTIYNSVLS